MKSLAREFPESSDDAWYLIRVALRSHGFKWQRGNVYLGDDRVNAVTCTLAAIDLARTWSWFAACVRDIRMLRIEELNDLMPVVQAEASREHNVPAVLTMRQTK